MLDPGGCEDFPQLQGSNTGPPVTHHQPLAWGHAGGTSTPLLVNFDETPPVYNPEEGFDAGFTVTGGLASPRFGPQFLKEMKEKGFQILKTHYPKEWKMKILPTYGTRTMVLNAVDHAINTLESWGYSSRVIGGLGSSADMVQCAISLSEENGLIGPNMQFRDSLRKFLGGFHKIGDSDFFTIKEKKRGKKGTRKSPKFTLSRAEMGSLDSCSLDNFFLVYDVVDPGVGKLQNMMATIYATNVNDICEFSNNGPNRINATWLRDGKKIIADKDDPSKEAQPPCTRCGDRHAYDANKPCPRRCRVCKSSEHLAKDCNVLAIAKKRRQAKKEKELEQEKKRAEMAETANADPAAPTTTGPTLADLAKVNKKKKKKKMTVPAQEAPMAVEAVATYPEEELEWETTATPEDAAPAPLPLEIAPGGILGQEEVDEMNQDRENKRRLEEDLPTPTRQSRRKAGSPPDNQLPAVTIKRQYSIDEEMEQESENEFTLSIIPDVKGSFDFAIRSGVPTDKVDLAIKAGVLEILLLTKAISGISKENGLIHPSFDPIQAFSEIWKEEGNPLGPLLSEFLKNGGIYLRFVVDAPVHHLL